MASENPVSPKVIAAGIGSVVGPLVVTIITAFVDIMKSGAVVIPEPYQTIIYTAAAVLGAVFGAYVRTDGLRLPTVDGEALRELPDAEAKLAEAEVKLADPRALI